MANPNIVNVTDIRGKTAVANVNTVSSNIVVNASASNKIFKINSLVMSNSNTTTSANVDVSVLRAGELFHLAFNVPVPSFTSVVAISKDMACYLEEGDALRVRASGNNFIRSVCSYEEIS